MLFGYESKGAFFFLSFSSKAYKIVRTINLKIHEPNIVKSFVLKGKSSQLVIGVATGNLPFPGSRPR